MRKNKVFIILIVTLFLFALLILAVYLLTPKDRLQLLAACASQKGPKERSICVENWFYTYADPKDIKSSLNVIHTLSESGKIAGGQCHVYEHIAAKVAYETNGGNIQAILNACDSQISCSGGCYHSSLMEATHMAGLSDTSLQQLTQLCLQRLPRAIPDCFHGLGHGLVHASFYDLFEPLALCDKVASDSANQNHCYEGVFMQAARPDFVTGDNPPYFSKDDPLFPCSEVSPKYQLACYSGAGERTIAANKSITEAADVCSKLAKEEWQDACSLEVYRAIIRRKSSPEQKQQECLAFGQKSFKCFSWIAKYLAGNPNTREELQNFCAGLNDPEKKACVGTN